MLAYMYREVASKTKEGGRGGGYVGRAGMVRRDVS